MHSSFWPMSTRRSGSPCVFPLVPRLHPSWSLGSTESTCLRIGERQDYTERQISGTGD